VGANPCLLLDLHLVAPGVAEPSLNGKAPKSKKKSKAFSFCGLRSHLKEKWVIRHTLLNFLAHKIHRHKVIQVADEDVFVFDEHREELGFKD